MKRLSPLMGLFLAWSPPAMTAAETDEPPLGYTLQIGAENVRLESGKETELPGKFENPKVTLIPDLERHFQYAGVSFKYPAYFTFEADLDDDGTGTWTLSGNDFKIMVQAFGDLTVTPAEIVDQLKKDYGPGSRTEPVSRIFNGVTYSGLRIREGGDNTIIQDILAVPLGIGSLCLLLQDWPAEEKVSEVEAKLALKLLTESFEVKKVPPPPSPEFN